MEGYPFSQYLNGIDTLALFRPLLFQEPLKSLRAYLEVRAQGRSREIPSSYAAFAAALYETAAGDLGRCVLEQALTADTPYVRAAGRGEEPPECMRKCLETELRILQNIAELTPEQLLEGLRNQEIYPKFDNMEIDLPAAYFKRLGELGKFGYGVFAQAHMFCLDSAGGIVPVRYPDPIRLSDLTEYQRERELVLRNIHALLEGRPAANMLLSGDAGTGKSSTVKAAGNALKDQGLRIIEVRRDQLGYIPDLLHTLRGNPLKFILFIDDLSFQKGDEQYSALKAALEGSISARSGNVVICATSNRRRLVKESFSDREGDDVHRRETMQETASLSERFGLHITFEKPDQAGYLRIVRHLAAERGLAPADLDAQAERFALARGGRSPRAARQFVAALPAIGGCSPPDPR